MRPRPYNNIVESGANTGIGKIPTQKFDVNGDAMMTKALTSEIKTNTSAATDLTITTGTEKTLVLATPVWDDIVVPIGNLRGGATPPSFLAFLNGVYAVCFQDANSDIVYGSFEIPHDYKEGTALDPHLHWSPSTTNTGNCVFTFEYTIANMNDTFGATNTSISFTQAGSGTAFKHQYVDGSSTISGNGLKIGAIVLFALSRPAGDGFTGDAYLHSFGIHYQIDTLGSRQEGVK